MSDDGASPYARACGPLTALGYHPIAVMPLEKAPGLFEGGRWRRMAGWQAWRDRPPGEAERAAWALGPRANIGLVLGSPAGDDEGEATFLIAVDIDAEDPDAFADIAAALPASPMVKRGAKGETRFYRAAPTIRSAAYDDMRGARRARLVDLLTGFDARQTVVPPSVHVDRAGRPSGKVYQWLAGPVAAAALPLFTAEDLAALEETLECHGWARRARANPRNAAHKTGGDFARIKAAAMANLSAWVPHLGLYRCRPAREGFEAVAAWRPSSGGRALETRKRNLSIQPVGIKDFGSGETFSPIDLVMAARGESAAWAAQWLRERLSSSLPFMGRDRPRSGQGGEVPRLEHEDGGGEGGDAPQGFPTRLPLRSSHPPHKGEGEERDELPRHLTRVPGLVGELVDWICDTARRPQRALALGAALTLVGTAAGRRYAGPTRTGTQLYVLALARTAAGKDHAYQAIPQVLTAAGLSPHIGPSSFMSVSAVVNRVAREPLTLCAMDEFGSFMSRMKNRRGSTHEQAIPGYLRTLWSSSFRTVPSPEWASRSAEPVHAPCLSIYGVSTFEEFYEALGAADLSNGFLNRFLLLSTRRRPAERDAPRDPFAVPAPIREALREIHGAGAPHLAALAHRTRADPPLIAAPWADEAARTVYADFGRRIEAREADAAWLARTAEMAQRLALIRAVGIRPLAPRIDAADMAWGCEVALWSATRMAAECRDYMAENDNQAAARKVVRIVRARGEMLHADLVRAMQHTMRARDLKDLIGALVEAGEIRVREARPERGGVLARYYRAGPSPPMQTA